MGKGQELYKRAKQIIPGGTQLLSKRPEMYLPEQWPAYFSKAEGPYVWDLDGRRYTDMSNFSVGACPLGYADPDVNAAVKKAVDNGNISTLNCPEEVELAESLVELHPWAEMVRYARGGGDAMVVAVRIARARTGRSKVAFCGYHGWHDWYLAANLSQKDNLGEKGIHLGGLEPAGVPKELAGTALPFRHHSLQELKKILSDHPGEIAAIVTEVQRGDPMPQGNLQAIRELADQVGAVLIFDEVTSGFRLNVGGVHLLYGVNPDIAVFAKAMGNGYPVGAVIGRETVMQAVQKSFVSSTYWTERIGFVAALETIRKMKAIDAPGKMIQAGKKVQQIWSEAAVCHGVPVQVGPKVMYPLSHLKFEVENARAVKTLWCQLMLDAGYLDNTGFYATAVHTDEVLRGYQKVVDGVFCELSDAIKKGLVQSRLRGPIAHSGFERLMD